MNLLPYASVIALSFFGGGGGGGGGGSRLISSIYSQFHAVECEVTVSRDDTLSYSIFLF